MNSFFCALMLTLCVNFGVRQRLMPFYALISQKKKWQLGGIYTAAAAVNAVGLAAALSVWGMEAGFTYLRFGGIAYAVILSGVNILMIPGRLREHLFLFGAVLTCNYLLLSVPNYLLTVLPVATSDYLYVVVVAYAGVLLLTHIPMATLLQNTVEPFLHMPSDSYWNTIWYMPLALFVTRFLYLGGEHNQGSFLQLINCILYIGIIVLMCVGIRADCRRIQEGKIMQAQLADQKAHYAELKVKVEEARKARHDFKHHLAAILHYVDEDDKEGLRRYCRELTGEDDTQDRIPYTGNPVADGLLYHYMRQARKNQIDFSLTGTIHSHGIADVDLCALLGNALDNALTACLTVQDSRRIHVICQSEKHLLSIVIRNTFDGEVKKQGDGILSRKRENEFGIGLDSMRSICSRYGGSMDVQWDEKTFDLMIMLPLSYDGQTSPLA